MDHFEGGKCVRTTHEAGHPRQGRVDHYEGGKRVRVTYEEGHTRHGEVHYLASAEVASSMGGESTCVICFSGEKTQAAVPCGHLCACDACAARLGRCPACRADVARWVRVWVV